MGSTTNQSAADFSNRDAIKKIGGEKEQAMISREGVLSRLSLVNNLRRSHFISRYKTVSRLGRFQHTLTMPLEKLNGVKLPASADFHGALKGTLHSPFLGRRWSVD